MEHNGMLPDVVTSNGQKAWVFFRESEDAEEVWQISLVGSTIHGSLPPWTAGHRLFLFNIPNPLLAAFDFDDNRRSITINLGNAPSNYIAFDFIEKAGYIAFRDQLRALIGLCKLAKKTVIIRMDATTNYILSYCRNKLQYFY